jgi:hypothetical protein
MYVGFKHLHLTLSYFLLLLLLAVIVVAFLRRTSNIPYAGAFKKVVLAGLISAHLQLLFGLYLWFSGPWWPIQMGDSALRFKALEHPLTMLIAIVLITIGYSKAKRAQTESKAYKALFGFWLAGLLLILLRLPYDAYFSFSH